jgi:uncharacterized protein (DUF427 family)
MNLCGPPLWACFLVEVRVMATAKWNGAVIAQSNNTVIVEGNHYFPAESVRTELLQESDTETVCGWKGTAKYKSIVVDGQVNVDAAWIYENPKSQAEQIRGHYAFWKGVEVDGADGPDLTPEGASCEI